jgi:hypothetical protein
MSLIVPPWYWNYCTTTADQNPQAATDGVAFTAGANDADAAAVTVLSALAHDVHYIEILFAGIVSATNNVNALADLLVDPAGGTTWSELIDSLPCGFSVATIGERGYPIGYRFPLYIPSGSSLGVRARTRHTADITTGQVAINAFGDPSRPDAWWCGRSVETLGASAATSSGTAHTPGASNAFSAWATIGTSTGRYGAIQLGFGGTDAAAAAAGVRWQIGVGSSKLPGTPDQHVCITTNETAARYFNGWIPCDIPSGSAVQVRAASSAASPEAATNVTLHGVVV